MADALQNITKTVTKTVSDNYHELSRGGQVVKKIILASNALVLLFGLLLVIIGGIAAGGQINALTSTTLASGLIVIGIFIMLIALLGCWGAMTENKILLYVYFGLLIFFAVVEFAVGIAAYVKKDDLPTYTSQLWTGLYNTDRNGINDIENSLQCCGWMNYSDRSVPPFGTEPTCEQISAGGNSGGAQVGPCSTFYYETLQVLYGSGNAASRTALQNFQTQWQCCGWNNLVEQPPSYWVPYALNSSSTCVMVNGFTQTCSVAIQQQWYTHYYSSTPAGDSWVLAHENNFATPQVGYECCGWLSPTDAAVPPYTNNTCILTKNYTTSCAAAVDQALNNSLQITGGVGIALAILQIATIILTLVLIVKIPAGGSSGRRAGGNEEANAGVMEELHDEE